MHLLTCLLPSNSKGAWDTTLTSGTVLRPSQLSFFKALKKCRHKFNCLVNKMPYIKQIRPCLNMQTDSFHAKVFVYKPYSIYSSLEYFNSFQTRIYLCPFPWKWCHEVTETSEHCPIRCYMLVFLSVLVLCFICLIWTESLTTFLNILFLFLFAARQSKRLTFMYLANDVLQNGKRKGTEFLTEFKQILPSAFQTCAQWVNKYFIFNNYSSSPNGLWVNSLWGRRPNRLLTQRPWGREE